MEYGTNKPFLLAPCGKDYLWGGTRLKEDYHKEIDLPILAETWECSVHPDGLSFVVSGVHCGRSLQEVIAENPSYLGTHPDKTEGLPILVKLIDAREHLSVQVHPDDDYAAIHENGSLGKTEMWYVLDAEEDSELVYGFVRDMDRETLTHALETDSIEKYLQRVKIKKDDVFYVKAGTVHGIGAGAVIAEIQENSNLTYRLYDYHRVDKNGKARELHVQKAMEVADLKAGISPRQPLRMLRYKKGCATEFLCRCKYFQVERMLLNAEKDLKVVYQTDDTSFEVLLCVEGAGTLREDHEEKNFESKENSCRMHEKVNLTFKKGDCIFVPADSVPLYLTGSAQLLKIHC